MVEVVAEVTRFDLPARTETELRVPELPFVVLPALLLLVDIVAHAQAVVLTVMLLLVAMLRHKAVSK